MREGEPVHLLKNGIYERQKELHNIAAILAERAGYLGKRAAIGRVLTIVLGAFVATQEVAAKLFSADAPGVAVAYSLIGVTIAAVSGLEAAFKADSRSAQLKLLAATCQATIWQIDSQWQKTIGSDLSPDPIRDAQALLDTQDKVLTETHTKAADLGVNITQEVRDLWGGEPRAAA